VIGRVRLVIFMLTTGALAATAACAPHSVAALASATGAQSPAQPTPNLTVKQRDADPSRVIFEATGLDRSAIAALEKEGATSDRWKPFLTVHVIRPGANGSADSPAMLGTYRLDGNALRFEPRFPLEPGVRYRAEFDPDGGRRQERTSQKKRTLEFSLPERPVNPTAIVTAVYPSASTLPENLLRFYIHFSAPMSRGEAYRHIRLLDAAGKPVADPFLEIDEELWTGDGKRFTLLFDPGRIKRGLRPREEVGPVLVAGQTYELVVDPGWTDAGGNPLKAGFRKAFRAGPPDETSPDPKTWTVRPPAPASRDPLEVRFPEPLDRALLDRLIAVRDGSDRPVAGAISVADQETLWRFTPDALWPPGAYRLVIGTELEDAAGNSVARPFEVDEVRPITQKITSQTVLLPFRIGPASQ
jgi:hypothetical protein